MREELERREEPAAPDADGPAETADIAGVAWDGVGAAGSSDGVAAADGAAGSSDGVAAADGAAGSSDGVAAADGAAAAGAESPDDAAAGAIPHTSQ